MSNADKVQDRYTECRVLAHAWRYTTVENDGRDYVQGLRCLRCECEKFVTISRRGEIVRSSYRYPADYRIAGGIDAEDRAELRLRSMDLPALRSVSA